MAEIYRIAAVQCDVAFGDPATNMANMLAAFEETTANDAMLTVFPECALTGYCFNSLEEAREFGQTIPGPATDEMVDACASNNAYAIFGMLELDGSRLFNACVLVGPEGLIGSYRKLHLPFLGVDRFTTPGDRPLQVFDAGGLRIGMHICYDLVFPEAARSMALGGADLLVLPTNWPPGAECTADCVVNARALENKVYFLAVNRAGLERGYQFIGRSKIANPSGELIVAADDDEPTILFADIDVQLARQKKVVRIAGQFELDRFADRRPEFYDRLTQ